MAIGIGRRKFIRLLGGTAVAWPLAARAQQPGMTHHIGVLETISAEQNSTNLNAFRQGLRDLGYIEGQNLVIEYRSADGHDDRFASLASELVESKVDLIVTRGTPAVLATKAASKTIPVVMAAIGEPLIAVANDGILCHRSHVLRELFSHPRRPLEPAGYGYSSRS